MYLDHDETLRGQVVLIDPYIHKKSKLSKKSFLERVKNIKYLRTSYNSNYISFYITSVEEYNNLIKFHDLVNKGIFDFEHYKVFAIAIQPKLYDRFKSTSIEIVQKQITLWMAASYFFNPEKREIVERQAYRPLFEEIQNIVEKYFSEFPIPDFSRLTEELFNGENEKLLDEEKRCEEKYLEVCNEFYGTNPPEFLNSPFGYNSDKEWGVNDYHNFEFVRAYLNELDWKKIVVTGNSEDDMQRSESRDELWQKWKHIYTTFEQRKNFVYSFYFERNPKETNPPKARRKAIPTRVKNQVWQRDNGRCVQCGSKEKLEFDHIIPFSRGGSSTYRNLQLLCEHCNRSKGANL